MATTPTIGKAIKPRRNRFIVATKFGNLALAGRGLADTVYAMNPAYTWADNYGWFDDISDGPVSAEVTLRDGTPLEVDSAWVVPAPPNFAPDIVSIQTMWDVMVDTFSGLLVDYAVRKHAHVIVRGIRAFSDYEYELQMALMNRKLEPRLETVFMLPGEPYSYLSSKLVREIAQHGGPLNGLVPPVVEQRLRTKVS